MIDVGLGEFAVTKNIDEVLITHALGSCVALIMHCPVTKYTALAHIVLPERLKGDSFLEKKKGYFAKCIVPEIIENFLSQDNCDRRRLEISLIGGASALSRNDLFQIGERNTAAIINVLSQYKLDNYRLDVGGHESRTVLIEVKTGQIKIRRQKMII